MNETAHAKDLTVAVLGGTGAEGSGLAYRWAAAGLDVIVGSRELARAQAGADELNALLGKAGVRAMCNEDAARAATIVVLTVPHAAQQATILPLKQHLQNKVLVDVTVPLVPPRVDRVALPGGRSAVTLLQEALGDQVKVVAAFQNISAHHLKDPQHEIECDVLVCGDDEAAREQVVALARHAGLRGLHAGVLANAVATEALTSVLIAINKRYKVRGSGIRITGIAD